MKYIAIRLLTLLAVAVVGALLGSLVGVVVMGDGWMESMILGGCVGAFLGMLYDPRASSYTIPTLGGAKYPGNPDD